MTSHDLKIWLTANKMTQKTLAEKLGLTVKTVNSYCNKKQPKWLEFALVGLLIKGSNK